MYTFVLVRADTFVEYTSLSQQLCQVSISLVLFPPFEQSSAFFTNMWSSWRTTAKDYFSDPVR